MKVEKIERVETVTITLTREQVYQTQRFLHHDIAPQKPSTVRDLSELRNAWTRLYGDVCEAFEGQFGEG